MKHPSKSRFITALLPALAVAAFLPVEVSAQAGNCNASLEAEVDATGPFRVGEPVPIKLTLGLDYSGGNANYIDINHFEYLLDCGEGETYPACTPQGNTVVFDHASVQTTCTDAQGNTPATLITMDDGLITVDFTVQGGDPAAIRIAEPSLVEPPNTCEVTFDVQVDGLSASNQTREIVELTGWSGLDAVCENEAPASGAAASVDFMLENPNVVFWVRKDFSDDNPMAVNAQIQCNTGLPVQQSSPLSDPVNGESFPFVGFVVYAFSPGFLKCWIWEEEVPAGYVESYDASAVPNNGIAGDIIDDDPDFSGCIFDEVVGGWFNCNISNELLPSSFTVNKEWLGDALENDVDLVAPINWSCHNVLTSPSRGPTTVRGRFTLYGATDSQTISNIYPWWGGTSYCTANEQIIDSYVESDNSECSDVSIPFAPAPGAECTIYNTVFFEGIPTLSKQGLALLVLLMFGVGLVGFRRFA
ncbi:MAG: IPTL-CTERM sorting domain-containing protein [Gammaproteobacteria bacterium]|nr:IPTL-CTERM sorting domain-containing protein [Gammaproteobacteria bacterium]